MKKITERLSCIASLIGIGKTVADVGTDHGFLPIYLHTECESPYVVLSDISRASLQKAIDNVSSVFQEDEIKRYFDFRLGSGLDILKHGEVDAVVFAGMGGELMVKLMQDDIKKTESFAKFVFQPRTGQGFLRYWLLSNGFEIESEKLVTEGKFICEVLSANYTGKIESDLKPFVKNDVTYEITQKMLAENGELGIKFLNSKIKKENFIKNGLDKTEMEVSEKKAQNIENLKYLNELLNKCGM